MESKPVDWSHLLLLVLVVSLHRSSHAQPATSSTWPGSTIKDAFDKTHFSDILMAFLCSIVFMIFFSLLIRHCLDTCATTTTHISAATADRRRREVIDNCPVLVYSEVKELRIGNSALECAVCLSEFEESDKIRLLPKCNHVFHLDCIDRWLATRLTCPVCRAKITPSDCADNTDADVVMESSHDESPAADSGIEQQSTVDQPPEPVPAETIDADDESGSTDLPTQSEPPRRSRMAVERFARSYSTGHCLFMESEGVIERYTLRLPEHVREEIFGKKKIRLRRCVSSNDVVLKGEWSSKKGSDSMERWVLLCVLTTPSFVSKDWISVKSLKQNADQSSSSSSSRRPPV